MTDGELLSRYVSTRCEDALAEIVRRRSPMVYSTCVRVLGDPGAAADAAQATFLALVRCAPKLSRSTVLSGWLFVSARNAARKLRRAEARRARHEQEAAMVRVREGSASWEQVRPELDAAMASLPRKQRDAVVLRYLQGSSESEVAAEMGCSRSTVSMRIAAGLTRLRRRLRRQGVTVPAAVLVGLLSERTTEVVPAGLAPSVQAVCLGKAAAAARVLSTTEAIMKAMMWTKIKLAAAVFAGATIISAGAAWSLTALGAAAPGPPPAPGTGVAVLDTTSFWRYHMVLASEKVRRESGEPVDAQQVVPAYSLRHVEKEKRFGVFKIIDKPWHTALPPAGWTGPGFEDRAWPRLAGPLGTDARYRSMAMLCLRGRFNVKRPADMALSLSFHGGAVVYVNGKELKRAHLPAGRLGPEALAEGYPKEAFRDPDGKLLDVRKWHKTKGKHQAECFALRVRRLSVKVPASMLRKGANVLAVELHRAPALDIMVTGDKRASLTASYRNYVWWSRLGLAEVRLSAPAGAEVTPNVARPKGLQVWNHPVVQRVRASDYGDPNDPVVSIRIVGARNGSFSGKVVVGSSAAIKGLKAQVTALKGPGGAAIPASALRVRYGRLDGHWSGLRVLKGKPAYFDGLEESGPAEIPVYQETRKYGRPVGSKGAVRPVWVTVDVPAAAKPGDYAGKLTVSAQGAGPVEGPIRLHVAGWVLPDSKEFATHVGIIQSPDSVAMKYGVKMWSEEHWKLLEKSFALLGYVGCDVVYIPLLCRTHFGNPHTMVYWIKKPGGKYEHDFSIADRYLGLAVRHLGKVPVVCLYCWEQYTGGFGWEMRGRGGKAGSKGVLFTVKAPGTGKLQEVEGPKWGTPQAREFWKPVLVGMKKILEKHGVGGSLMLGLAGDIGPSKECLADLESAIPEACWVAHSHQASVVRHGRVGYLSFILNQGVYDPEDVGYWKRPGKGRYHGWRNPGLWTAFPRVGSGTVGGSWEYWSSSPPSVFRAGVEGFLMAAGSHYSAKKKSAGLRGFGRLGADFWDVLKDKRGRNQGALPARYPESGWGQLNVSYGTRYLLAPGRDGPGATIRLEMLREGLQETEARIFLEKALLDEAKKALLGAELARRAQALLDERQRAYPRFVYQDQWRGGADPLWYPNSGWQEASEKLFALAAQVAGKLGTQ